MENRQFPRADIRWPVLIETNGHSTEGVTLNISPNGIFIRCAKPLRLNESFDLAIRVPNSDHSLRARVEVIWSNIYGPDDHITPRGMGVRFLKISSGDRKFIAKAMLQHLGSEKEKIDPKKLENLQTLTIEKGQIKSEAA